MSTPEPKRFRTKLQAEAEEWLLRGEPNVMVTLTFSGDEGVSYKFAERTFGIFAHKLKCHLFGKKSKKRILMCPIVEEFGTEMMWSTSDTGTRQGTHIHCLMKLPGSPASHKDLVMKLWRASGRLCGNPIINCSHSDDWFREIATEDARAAVTSYALKQCSDNIDGVLIKFMPTRPTT